MFPKGTIYNSRKSSLHGEVYLHANLKQKIAYTLARGIGAGLVGFVIIAALFTFGPLIKDEVTYDTGANKINLNLSSSVDPNQAKAESTSQVQQEAQNLGLNSYFSIVIPKIGAKANIIANVDTSNEAEYDKALAEGVAQAKGTNFPGQGKNIFLFAHSTNSPLNVARYNAVFYLLDKMSTGDQIVIYFADKRYVYQVSETKIVGPTDTSPFNVTNDETLILQTCYPPGTSWNRLLVIAKLVDK